MPRKRRAWFQITGDGKGLYYGLTGAGRQPGPFDVSWNKAEDTLYKFFIKHNVRRLLFSPNFSYPHLVDVPKRIKPKQIVTRTFEKATKEIIKKYGE